MKKILLIVVLATSMSLLVNRVLAAEVSKAQIKGLDEQVQEIKKDVLAISSELALLEEKLLYPSNTQISVFVSIADNTDFRLDAMDIKLDGQAVVHHLYTAKELEALRNGGVQRIYTGNVQTGTHSIEVSFLAKSQIDGMYQKTASYKITKGVRPKLVEIKVSGEALAKAITFKER